MTDGILRDVTMAREIQLTKEVLRYNSPIRHQATITALQQIFGEASANFGYYPHRLMNLRVHDLDGTVYGSQPVILCDGPNDEAVIWQKHREGYDHPHEEDGHPDFGLYVFKMIE
jgi:hypothetical protein